MMNCFSRKKSGTFMFDLFFLANLEFIWMILGLNVTKTWSMSCHQHYVASFSKAMSFVLKLFPFTAFTSKINRQYCFLHERGIY